VSVPTDKDVEQDVLIRQNAENIRRNEEAIRRQTEALEKIRDHYFPKRTITRRVLTFFLKVVGAVTVAAGILESADWYWNVRLKDEMAEQSSLVAKRLFFKENDVVGAVKFLERAVELNDGQIRYRIALGCVRGLAAIADLIDLERPLTPDERARVDEILSEAVYLMEVAPEEPLPHVLAAQAYGLRGETAAAVAASERALQMAPDNVQVQVTACAMRFAARDVAAARERIAAAERLNENFPPALYWKAFLTMTVDRDFATAGKEVERLLSRAPRFAPGHLLLGRIRMGAEAPDYRGARAAFARALELVPRMTRAIVLTGEAYAREGNLPLARLWFDRVIEKDPNDMRALTARARLCGGTGEWKTAEDDLTKAIGLAPFRADLYRERAKVRRAAGEADGATRDAETAAALVNAGEK